MKKLGEEELLEKYLYKKEVLCPCCGQKNTMVLARKSKAKIEDRDSDFFIRYRGDLNLYFYEVWVCEHCGYAALMNDFPAIKKDRIVKIQDRVTSQWQPKFFSAALTVEDAIERYKLALVSAIAMESPPSQKGIICLKIAWMYRLKEDPDQESRFLALALESLEKAYMEDPMPFYGLDKLNTMYLLGEINRRLKNTSEALKWYGLVLTSREADQKLKAKVRDQRERITVQN